MDLLGAAGGSPGAGAVAVAAERFAPDAETARVWFWNVNTPEDLAQAEALVDKEKNSGSNLHHSRKQL
jgi:GTP:adenosylcobinamide-phosphate guanylyltransferase